VILNAQRTVAETEEVDLEITQDEEDVGMEVVTGS
jgi:hypothetical protein